MMGTLAQDEAIRIAKKQGARYRYVIYGSVADISYDEEEILVILANINDKKVNTRLSILMTDEKHTTIS